MRVRREYNVGTIKLVLEHPGIFDSITEDGADEVGVIDPERTCFLSLLVRGNVVGVYALLPINSVELDIHAHIIPEYRKQYARPLTRLMYQWVIDNTGYQKLTASIPVIYPNVISFAKEFGMQEEGVNRLSWAKGGEIHDQQRLGITRSEIEEFLS